MFGVAVGIEAQHGRGHAGFDREHVPDVEWDDVGDQEVDVRGAVDGAAFADGVGGASFVGVGAQRVGGFDLDAEEAASIVEDEVAALTVSPGLGDAEAELAGFVEESGFGALAASLGVGFVATKAAGVLEGWVRIHTAAVRIVWFHADPRNTKGAAMAAPVF